MAKVELSDEHATIDDLRYRLNEERAKRQQTADRLAAAQAQITALLTDQRPPPAPAKRRWWRWRS